MSGPVSAAVITAATIAALALIWHLDKRARRRSDAEHARKMAAARQDTLRARGIDGTHEKCEVPEREELAWERIATSHATFGQDALRRTSA